MIGVLNNQETNQTVNNAEDEDETDSGDRGEEASLDDDEDFNDVCGKSGSFLVNCDDPSNGSNGSEIEDECNNLEDPDDDEINSAEEEEPNNNGIHEQKAFSR